jgi:succinate dehydrogenase / fumarate reductase flavoprotein subunit
LERRYPAFGNLVPRDVASRAAKERCDAGYGVGTTKQAVFLDFKYNLINKYGKAEANKQGIENPDEATLVRLGKEVVKKNMETCLTCMKRSRPKILMKCR